MTKWTLIKGACALVTATAVFVACTDAKHERKEGTIGSQFRVDAKSIMEDPELSKQEKAKQLVAAGEQLLMPETFHLANAVFEQALATDSGNQLAEVYVELLKPAMNLKGILGRIEPMVKKDDREYSKYKKQLDAKEFFIEGYYDGRIHGEDGSTYVGSLWNGSYMPVDFLADSEGMPMINNEAELQEFIKSQALAFDNVRRYLNKNINLELEISISNKWTRERSEDRGQLCHFKVISEMQWDVECASNPTFMKAKIDRGDMEALKAMAAGMQIYHILSAAYDASEAQRHMMVFRGKGKIYSTRYKIESVFETNEKSATLKDDNMLDQILELGKDGMIGARWIRENIQTMCPGQREDMAFVYRGYDYDQQSQTWKPRRVLLRREGQLFDQGICWDEIDTTRDYKQMGQLFDTIDKALAGEEVEIRTYKKDKVMNTKSGKMNLVESGEQAKALIKPSLFFTHPIKDARDIKASEYDECGEISGLSDKSLNGIFVNEDAETFFKDIGELDKGNCGSEF